MANQFDSDPTSKIVANPNNLSSVLAQIVHANGDLYLHDGPGAQLSISAGKPVQRKQSPQGDSFYLISYLKDEKERQFTLLFHLMQVDSPAGSQRLLAMSLLKEDGHPVYRPF